MAIELEIKLESAFRLSGICTRASRLAQNLFGLEVTITSTVTANDSMGDSEQSVDIAIEQEEAIVTLLISRIRVHDLGSVHDRWATLSVARIRNEPSMLLAILLAIAILEVAGDVIIDDTGLVGDSREVSQQFLVNKLCGMGGKVSFGEAAADVCSLFGIDFDE